MITPFPPYVSLNIFRSGGSAVGREVHSNLVQNVDIQSDLPIFSLRLYINKHKVYNPVGCMSYHLSHRDWPVWAAATEKLQLTAENGAFIYLCTLNGPIH